MAKKSLLASGLSLSFFTLCSRVLGLIREMTKARFLGTSVYADAFGIAFMIPNLFRRLFAENAISVAFIPTFRGYLERTDGGTADTKDFLRATFTLVSFLTAAVVTAGMAITPLIIPFFYDGNDPFVLAETTLLTRIMFPYLFVISVAAFFQGVLNGVKIFSPSGFTPVLFNALVIAVTYALAPHTANPARAMAVGVVAGGCVQALFQLPFVIRTSWATGFTTLRNAFCNPGTRKVMRLILPTIVGMAAYQLNDMVSTALAGRAG
ncbi:MAG: murein biosynthesis integral membrane protein MurJ, partial [Treponemataceae bacterium]|nr:murein biosynthesis integral membrane protein MurJ [Treponemataceae bacterium]